MNANQRDNFKCLYVSSTGGRADSFVIDDAVSQLFAATLEIERHLISLEGN